MHSSSRLRRSLAVGGVAAAILLATSRGGGPASAAEPAPDFGFFRERVEPVLQAVCAECHAGKGHGQFALVVHAVGAPISEAESRKNYETVLKLLVPGKPDQSKFLLKPLALRDGGAKHEGGDRIFKGTPAYRAWVDFIDGVRGPPTAAPAAPAPAPAAAPTGPGQPDLGFFVARIEPVLQGVCSQCHAGVGKGQFALVTHVGGTRFPLADHRKNFETVLRLLVPGKPEQSKFLLKPLAEADGGVKHGGGDRIRKDDANYKNWVDFIHGVKGPTPVDPPPEEVLPSVLEKGLVLQAEQMKTEGDAQIVPLEGGHGKAVAPGPAGGRAIARFRTGRPAEYTIHFRAGPATEGFRMRVDDGEPLAVDPPADAFADVAPVVPLDGTKPLDARLGRLVVDGEALSMDGREGTARWLSPADLPHTRVAATVSVPAEDDAGRDDAWLLFDGLDADNGKFFGLSDGGRRIVMGVVEGGTPRILRSVPAPAGIGGDKPATLAVDLLDGVAVGRVEGHPVLFVNFDRGLGAARFGFLTHGLAVVRGMSVSRGDREVHRVGFAAGGVVRLARGNHTLVLDLPPRGAAIAAVTVKAVPE